MGYHMLNAIIYLQAKSSIIRAIITAWGISDSHAYLVCFLAMKFGEFER